MEFAVVEAAVATVAAAAVLTATVAVAAAVDAVVEVVVVVVMVAAALMGGRGVVVGALAGVGTRGGGGVCACGSLYAVSGSRAVVFPSHLRSCCTVNVGTMGATGRRMASHAPTVSVAIPTAAASSPSLQFETAATISPWHGSGAQPQQTWRPRSRKRMLTMSHVSSFSHFKYASTAVSCAS